MFKLVFVMVCVHLDCDHCPMQHVASKRTQWGRGGGGRYWERGWPIKWLSVCVCIKFCLRVCTYILYMYIRVLMHTCNSDAAILQSPLKVLHCNVASHSIKGCATGYGFKLFEGLLRAAAATSHCLVHYNKPYTCRQVWPAWEHCTTGQMENKFLQFHDKY
jgi:hypothetical protein